MKLFPFSGFFTRATQLYDVDIDTAADVGNYVKVQGGKLVAVDIPAGGGGGSSIVFEKEVLVGEDISFINIPDLDIVTDKMYEIFISAPAGIENLRVSAFVDGDEVAENYSGSWADNTERPWMAFLTTTEWGTKILRYRNVIRLCGGRISWDGISIGVNSALALFTSYNVDVVNLTALKLVGDANFPVGLHVVVRKLK